MNFYVKKYELDAANRLEKETIKDPPIEKPKMKEIELQSDSMLKLTFTEKVTVKKVLDKPKSDILEEILDIRMILKDDYESSYQEDDIQEPTGD
jgi:hypothetical protein